MPSTSVDTEASNRVVFSASSATLSVSRVRCFSVSTCIPASSSTVCVNPSSRSSMVISPPSNTPRLFLPPCAFQYVCCPPPADLLWCIDALAEEHSASESAPRLLRQRGKAGREGSSKEHDGRGAHCLRPQGFAGALGEDRRVSQRNEIEPGKTGTQEQVWRCPKETLFEINLIRTCDGCHPERSRLLCEAKDLSLHCRSHASPSRPPQPYFPGFALAAGRFNRSIAFCASPACGP